MLISLFSNPDPTPLQLSVNTLWSCKYLGNSALKFINIKCICAIVAMVPHAPVIGEQPVHEQFFLIEMPSFDIGVILGIKEDTIGEEQIKLNGDASI